MKKALGHIKKIGVLMGGNSNERNISLSSGRNILAALIRLGYDAVGIDVRDYLPGRLREHEIDAAFIALHGVGGEDGSIQGFLEYLQIPYTGSGVTASALAMDKLATKRILLAEKLPTPDFLPVSSAANLSEVCSEIIATLGLPVVIKPNNDGSSIGVKIVKDEELLFRAVQEVKNEYDMLLAEKYIDGKELTVGVIRTGDKAEALPVLELEPKVGFYDYDAKYTEGMTDFIIPADITDEMTKQVQEMSVRLHNLIGCRDMSRVDFMLTGTGEINIIEINTIPGFTNLSDLPAEASAAGMTFDELIETVLRSAFAS